MVSVLTGQAQPGGCGVMADLDRAPLARVRSDPASACRQCSILEHVVRRRCRLPLADLRSAQGDSGQARAAA
jgi:hypothetical protein